MMELNAKEKTIIKEISIQAPKSLVWHAWTRADRVSQWFAAEANIEAKVNSAYELYFIPGNKTGMNTKGCKVSKLVREEQLNFTWKGPDQFSAIMNNEENLTIVEVRFEAIKGEQTLINIFHHGFKDEESWNEAIAWHEMAWTGVLESLKSALEKGEGSLCCQP
jgi:uncharacterized protein YndB with AHSA1/START domain